MLEKLIFAIAMFAVVLVGVKLTHILVSKFKINRWVLAFISPLILIVPSIAFPSLNPIVWKILQIIFSLTCIMFFEITRMMIENNEIKGIIKYERSNRK
ncbi:hypothetical protein OXH55_14625 [Clostridium ganghwense]|uniref:DUF2304 domain-containing protein n=2 Tax=Clostridium ganghwense TaxID=312089 RepID=A0ABT4CTW7_9CLOT|nr:hypothetical protein [Clostridium ganghwense]